MPFLIFGSEAKVKQDNNIPVDLTCPSCLNAELHLIIFEKSPSVFWIPIKQLSYDQGPGFICKYCEKIYPIEEEKLKKLAEDYYNKNISKKQLIKGLNRLI